MFHALVASLCIILWVRPWRKKWTKFYSCLLCGDVLPDSLLQQSLHTLIVCTHRAHTASIIENACLWCVWVIMCVCVCVCVREGERWDTQRKCVINQSQSPVWAFPNNFFFSSKEHQWLVFQDCDRKTLFLQLGPQHALEGSSHCMVACF